MIKLADTLIDLDSIGYLFWEGNILVVGIAGRELRFTDEDARYLWDLMDGEKKERPERWKD